jgi:uncharacterized surface protein with fasciclin (FAS1) repeats
LPDPFNPAVRTRQYLDALFTCNHESLIHKLQKSKEKMTRIKNLFSLVLALAIAGTLSAQKTKMVGGAAMYPSKDIVENAMNSKDHTTLVAAVKAAGLVETLQGDGPFTVFAPTNDAFGMLPAGAVEGLLKPENKNMLTAVLTYHVVAGKYDAKTILDLIKKGNGKATLKTVQGGILTAMTDGKTVMLKDEKGGVSNVTIADVNQRNGIIHVVDHVVMPK